ncbi:MULTISPECIES: outer membrane beta-barrel protein [Flavobacterium]|jgi:opacity protein-like surface antigen|uniref:Outer membrane beta-barrel protein n=1 Tax=Flavobacterium cupriresistens TaxID=2893885 RepID=A0ABU4RFE9_9FLAO|nr:MULTISPECIES: outer membrane beta-barrel protein [unclassified Flavobacterium]KLT68986.1 membrane protein [Flavobacterium sp. ABG]MDX6190991.1 outer membrane beta-barrel protein [Flavobacterium sp. Fl-318]UFH43838.1 porin family protein [Flavobacterium sp. F-323]
MKKNLFLLGLLVCSMATMAQTEKAEKPESWYFKLGGSYFNQTASTEFPTVGGNDALNRTYAGGKLVSEESITGSFGQGFRTGITAGYRFSVRLGVELGVNYYSSTDKKMAQTTTDAIFVSGGKPIYNFKSVGQITAFDVAPALVMFLGESHGFEPYTKVGVLVPIHGDLEITTDAVVPTGVANPATVAVHSVDKVKPNPTIGFTAALGTSYKLGKHISAFAELEYRNFTVHGKTKETTKFTQNGQDALATRTTAQIHTNYQDRLDVNSNNALTNPNGVNKDKPMDELSSYVGISGLGLTLGLKYSL